MRANTLTSLMAITLSEEVVETFSPDDAIGRWLAAGKSTSRQRIAPYDRDTPEQAPDYTSSESETDPDEL
ncbi:Hypp634 [Branchiostoma lanceolatum]|uniref:Hypp634 protein n=1 Tax=Branchiostoma lanceolatum TaxID=7740 RepID=A0A8J9VBM4_BRALA|nr:Hypp634 [Branchiostoma lanceolatum]